MAERIWRCQNDHGTTRSAHPPLRYRRNRQRKLALQEPRLTAASRSLATALWGRARSRLAPPYTIRRGSLLNADMGSKAGANSQTSAPSLRRSSDLAPGGGSEGGYLSTDERHVRT